MGKKFLVKILGYTLLVLITSQIFYKVFQFYLPGMLIIFGWFALIIWEATGQVDFSPRLRKLTTLIISLALISLVLFLGPYVSDSKKLIEILPENLPTIWTVWIWGFAAILFYIFAILFNKSISCLGKVVISLMFLVGFGPVALSFFGWLVEQKFLFLFD